MIDVLPSEVLVSLRDLYFAGVTEAEIAYEFNAGDEDALTGALGQALLHRNYRVYLTDGRVYRINAHHYKIRGRGKGAPEKQTGADGIFQIEVFDEQNSVVRTKGLLFQAKKLWTGTDDRLLDQVRQMERTGHSTIVIDFRPRAYLAVEAIDVVLAHGTRKRLRHGAIRKLGEVLGVDFLQCRIGVVGMFWDPKTEALYSQAEHRLDLLLGHVIHTVVRREE